MSTEDTLIEASTVGEADTTPLAGDELRQVDKLFAAALLHPDPEDAAIQHAWADSRGLLPSTLQSWGMGYVSAKIPNIIARNKAGLQAGDLMRAGLLHRRRLVPHVARFEHDHKHALDTDDKDRRSPLLGYRWALGGRVAIPLHDHHGAIRTWIGRLVDDSKSLRELAGDYHPEEADMFGEGAEPAKYLNLGKERSSREAAGAAETERFPITLSPSFIARCSGLVLADTFDPSLELGKTEHDKLSDKETGVWLTEGHLDAVLASQAGVSAIATGGCRTDPKQHLELIRLLTKFASFHVPIYLCFDADPEKWEKDKDIKLGAGQRGMCRLLAKVWAKDPTLARAIKIVKLPQPSEGEKVDLADVLRDVYRGVPQPAPTGGAAADHLAWVPWQEAVVASQKAKLEELARNAVESVEYLIAQIPQEVRRRDIPAALEECGLASVAAHDPDLWAEVGERVAELLGIERKERKSWVKSIMKAAEEEAEIAERKSGDDPLTRYKNKDGSIRPTWMSCLEILKKEFGGSMRWDEMSLTVVLETTTGSGKTVREKLDKKKFAKVRAMMATRYGCDVKKMDLEDAISDLAVDRPVHPVQEWLRGLPTWDGVDRMPEIMKALGVSSDRGYPAEKVTLYSTEMRKTLVAAVARACDPGCQVDTMLVLQGDQGIKKSTFFKALVPDISWYGGAGRLDPEAKDGIMGLRKKWILEVAEVDRKSFFSSSAEWKDLITTPVDSLRPPYMRDVEDYPRTSIFMGSTNVDQFLSDPTGARRFWVIPLNLKKLKGEDIDKASIIKIRTQLWAQAYAIYTAWVSGGRKEEECPWWLNLEEEIAHSVDVTRHQVDDLELDQIRTFLDKQHSRTVTGIELAAAIGEKPASCGRKIARHMKCLGWTKHDTNKCSAYTAPDEWRPGAGGLSVHQGGADPATIVASILAD